MANPAEVAGRPEDAGMNPAELRGRPDDDGVNPADVPARPEDAVNAADEFDLDIKAAFPRDGRDAAGVNPAEMAGRSFDGMLVDMDIIAGEDIV